MHCISYTVYHMSFMHPKSKKVCGACFSVSTNCGKKCVNLKGKYGLLLRKYFSFQFFLFFCKKFKWFTDFILYILYLVFLYLFCVWYALKKKLRYYLGIFPKWRTPPPHPPLLGTPYSKKNVSFILHFRPLGTFLVFTKKLKFCHFCFIYFWE